MGSTKTEVFKSISDSTKLEEEVEKFITTWPGYSDQFRAYLRKVAQIFHYALNSPFVKEKKVTGPELAKFNECLELFAWLTEELGQSTSGELQNFMKQMETLFEGHRFAWIKYLQRSKLRFLVLFTMNNILWEKFLHIASYAKVNNSGELPYNKQVQLIEGAEEIVKPKKEPAKKEVYRAKRIKPRFKGKAPEKNKSGPVPPVLNFNVENWYDDN